MPLQDLAVDQKPPMPGRTHPILSIGAGDIVRHAHYPAYRMAGFPVVGVCDTRPEVARALAEEFSVPLFDTLGALIAQAAPDSVFDLAVPAIAIIPVLEQLPDGSAVLIQKPMGENLEQARRIQEVCHRKGLLAAVNFQLRFAPYVLAAKRLIAEGAIGELHDVDVKVNVHTPWERWDFLEKAPRMEIVYHSIHYLDLIRDLMGEPSGVHSRALKHQLSPKLESSRSTTILDYGDWRRAVVHTNHGHVYGPRHQESYAKLEGSKGAIKFQMGLNMNYPEGRPDYLEVWTADAGEWRNVPLVGSWFPHAFVGTMASVMRAMEGLGSPSTSVDDAIRTMALVEAAYASSASGGTQLSSLSF